MSDNIINLDEYRKKKEQHAEKEIAAELLDMLNGLMLNDEPVIIEYEDSNGNKHVYSLSELYDLDD